MQLLKSAKKYNRHTYYTVIFDYVEIDKDELNNLLIYVLRLTYATLEVRKFKGIIYFSARMDVGDLKRRFKYKYPHVVLYEYKLTGKELEDAIKTFHRDRQLGFK